MPNIETSSPFKMALAFSVYAYKGRRSRMDAAYQKLVDDDRDKAVAYTENAKAILNGEDVSMLGIQEIRTKKKSFWEKLFKSKN